MKPFEQWLDELTDDLRKKEQESPAKTFVLKSNPIRSGPLGQTANAVFVQEVNWYNEVNTGWSPGNTGGIDVRKTANSGGLVSPPVERYGTQFAEHFRLELEKAWRQHFFNALYMQQVEIPKDGTIVFPKFTRATSNA